MCKDFLITTEIYRTQNPEYLKVENQADCGSLESLLFSCGIRKYFPPGLKMEALSEVNNMSLCLTVLFFFALFAFPAQEQDNLPIRCITSTLTFSLFKV